jgi:hypothetical protein
MTINALNVWYHWAAGHQITPERLIDAGALLSEHRSAHAALAAPLLDWLEQHGIWQPQPTIEPRHQTIEPRHQTIEPRGLEIDF